MWLLLWGLSSSKCGPLHKASVELLCCYMAGGFLPVNDPRKRSKRESRSHTIFSDLVLEVTYCHFCCIILVTQINPDTVWEKTAQRCAILRLATQEVNWEISDVYLDLKIDCFFPPWKIVVSAHPSLSFVKLFWRVLKLSSVSMANIRVNIASTCESLSLPLSS